jgi:transcriptional regulator with XRE-family HTH domain
MAENRQETTYSNILREKRIQHQMTQAELAEALGVSVITVGRWERGQSRPTTYYIKKLCQLFQATPEELALERKTKRTLSTVQTRASRSGLSQPSEKVLSLSLQEEHPQDSFGKHEGTLIQASSSDMQEISKLLWALPLVQRSLLHRLLAPGLLFACMLIIAGQFYLNHVEGDMLPVPRPPAGPTHPSALLQANKPASMLQAALASPLLYRDALNDPNAIDTEEKHWTAIEDICFFASDGYHVQGYDRSFCHETGAVYQDMAISVEMAVTEGYSGGLLLRDQDIQNRNGAYLFEVSTDGRYHITNLAMYGTIHNWTSSSALHRGYAVTNTLQVIASGKLFLFYLNGIYVTSIRDSWYKSGGISFACFAHDGPCEATFHNLNVYL